jgi:hypothetical protein
VLADLLAGDLAKDPGFAAELRELVDAASPHVDVVQRMEVATGVTGADIDELVRGSVRVEQVIGNARDVTGFRAKTVGRNPEQT